MKTRCYLWVLLVMSFLAGHAQQDETVSFSGEGTVESPYLISSADDLVELSRATNELGMEFAGQFFLMTDDIDLSAVTDFAPLSQNAKHPFNGMFEGDGHSIIGWTLQNAKQCGFVTWLGADGLLSNVVIDSSCKFLQVQEFAPLVYCAYGTINHCVNRAAIHGTGMQAGIVYVLDKGTVESCFNEGDIDGGAVGYAAGVVGVNFGTVTRSENVARVRAAQGGDVGGIVGENHGLVSNCVSAGGLTGYGAVGGLVAVGQAGCQIDFSLCTAVLKNYVDYSKEGAVIGYSSGEHMAIHEVYYDYQLSIFNKEGSKSIWPKTTSELINDPWSGSRAWTQSKGEYPRIYRNAQYPGSILAAKPVIFADGDTRCHVTQPAQLAEAEGLEWSLQGGQGVFEIDGSTLLVHPADTYTAAILRATYKGLTKEIVISNMGADFDESIPENWWTIKSSSDFDGDKKTDVSDLNRLINAVLELEGRETEYGDLDVLIDGKVDVEDVNYVVNRILGF
ncbi:MAG: hypothetical protein J5565_01150 [Muribaculaceae bacterium]|nr:hypothetical protein [Muribaculaceae bacterium]